MRLELTLVLFLGLLTGCGSPSSSSSQGAPAAAPNPAAALVGGPAEGVQVGGRYWTRTNLRIVKNGWFTEESYLSGEILPMGVPVTLVETAKSDTRWHIRTDDGREFWIQVGQKGTYRQPDQEIQKFLAVQDPKAGFDAGSGEVAEAIRAGRPVAGMTRAQALAALGFPPNISDPATAGLWKYPQLNHGWRGSGWSRIANYHHVSLDFKGDVVERVMGFEED